MKRKFITVFSAILLILSLLPFSACGDNESKLHGDPNANTAVPDGAIELSISQQSNGKNLIAFSAELDPHFLSYNVGRTGVNKDGKVWTCTENDWNDVVCKRVKEMNLQRIRMMFLPSWVASNKTDFENKTYTWDSVNMISVYSVLDLAKAENIDVNITYWGVDSSCEWLISQDLEGWCMNPREGLEEEFCQLFSDVIKYLLEERGYDCIKEITVFNEPTGIFNPYGNIKGNNMYCNICRIMHEQFVADGIRDKVKFCLSDDTSDSTWLAKTCSSLGDIMDIASSHSYYWGNEYTNKQMTENGPYALNNFSTVMKDYPDIPHFFGEVGINTGIDTHTVTDAASPQRALTVCRVIANMINSGASGASYWVLFNQYYDKIDSRIMNMGLWAFADENYVCRPIYYAYSLFTRFSQRGSDIFPIESNSPNLVAFALRSPNKKWSYFIINDGENDVEIGFVNHTLFPESMEKYVFEESNSPIDNKVIPASSRVTANGRVIADTVKARSFAVYSE